MKLFFFKPQPKWKPWIDFDNYNVKFENPYNTNFFRIRHYGDDVDMVPCSAYPCPIYKLQEKNNET